MGHPTGKDKIKILLASKGRRGHGREVSQASEQAKDDVVTVVAISVVAKMLANVVHKGLGHAAVAKTAHSLTVLRGRRSLAAALE